MKVKKINPLRTGVDKESLDAARKNGIKAIAVAGRIWIDKTYGTGYHTYDIQILCNNEDFWRVIVIAGRSYGSEDICTQNSRDAMKKLGFDIPRGHWYETKSFVFKRELHIVPDNMLDIKEIVNQRLDILI